KFIRKMGNAEHRTSNIERRSVPNCDLGNFSFRWQKSIIGRTTSSTRNARGAGIRHWIFGGAGRSLPEGRFAPCRGARVPPRWKIPARCSARRFVARRVPDSAGVRTYSAASYITLLGFFKKGGESFAGAMQFAAHGVGGLLGENADFLVAQLFVSDEQEEETVFIGQCVEGFLDAFAKFLGFKDAKGRVALGDRAFPDGFVGVGKHVPLVPGLLEVAAVIDGDAVKPSTPGGFTAELIHLAEGLE